MASGEYFLQGKGYYGDASKARNEVILCVGGKSEQLSQMTFLIPWALKNMFCFVFFLMFNLINWL